MGLHPVPHTEQRIRIMTQTTTFQRRFPSARDFRIAYYDQGPAILLSEDLCQTLLPGTQMTLGQLWALAEPWSHHQLTAIWELLSGMQEVAA